MPTYTMLMRDIPTDVYDEYMSTYPIFDPNYREELNKKIRDQYLMREIGYETVDLFLMALRRKMNLIMPMYNEFYRSKIDFDILSTIDVETTSRVVSESESSQETTASGQSSENQNANGSTDSHGRVVNLETPQQMLADNADYASGAVDNTTETAQTNSSTSLTDSESSGTTGTQANDTTDAVSRTKGYQGSAAALVMAYRDSIINVDEMVVSELSTLFMSISSHPGNYSERWFGGGYYL